MSVSANLKNLPEFQRLLREHLAKTRRSLPVALNSRMLNIVAKASRGTPKVERSTIEQELGVTGYAPNFGKRGQPLKRGRNMAKNAQTKAGALVYLIIQAARRRAGRKGLYGPAMKAAVTKLLVKRFRSVGTLKAGWTGAIRTLGKAVGQSFRNEGASASVKGKSVARIARDGFNPSVSVEYVTNSFDKNHQAYIDQRITAALDAAFASEQKELETHLRAAVDPVKQRGNAMSNLRSVIPELKEAA